MHALYWATCDLGCLQCSLQHQTHHLPHLPGGYPQLPRSYHTATMDRLSLIRIPGSSSSYAALRFRNQAVRADSSLLRNQSSDNARSSSAERWPMLLLLLPWLPLLPLSFSAGGGGGGFQARLPLAHLPLLQPCCCGASGDDAVGAGGRAGSVATNGLTQGAPCSPTSTAAAGWACWVEG